MQNARENMEGHFLPRTFTQNIKSAWESAKVKINVFARHFLGKLLKSLGKYDSKIHFHSASSREISFFSVVFEPNSTLRRRV